MAAENYTAECSPSSYALLKVGSHTHEIQSASFWSEVATVNAEKLSEARTQIRYIMLTNAGVTERFKWLRFAYMQLSLGKALTDLSEALTYKMSHH